MNLQNSGLKSRENNQCRPSEGWDPYAAADLSCKWWSTALFQQLLTVVMGPGFRRGDGWRLGPRRRIPE